MNSFEDAANALHELLSELPYEFSTTDIENPRNEFKVIKKSNVRKVHKSLLVLQDYFGFMPLEGS